MTKPLIIFHDFQIQRRLQMILIRLAMKIQKIMKLKKMLIKTQAVMLVKQV